MTFVLITVFLLFMRKYTPAAQIIIIIRAPTDIPIIAPKLSVIKRVTNGGFVDGRIDGEELEIDGDFEGKTVFATLLEFAPVE